MRIRKLAALAVLAMGCTAVQAEPQKLKFAVFEPPQTIASSLWTRWAEKVNKDGAGAIEIEMYTAGALGRDPRNQLELLLNGVADISFVLPFFSLGRFPDNTVTNLPLIIGSAREGSIAIWALYEKGLLRGYDDLLPLALFTAPPTIMVSTRPIPSLASLAGLKVSASTDLQQKMLRALGAAPVSGFIPQTSAEALSRGTLEVDLTNFTASVSNKQFDVAKNALILPVGPSTLMVAMNKASYAKLSPAARAAIDRNKGMPLVKMWFDALDAREDEVRAKWRADPGRTYTELSPAEMARAEAALMPVMREWENANPNSAVLIKTLREEVAKARATR